MEIPFFAVVSHQLPSARQKSGRNEPFEFLCRCFDALYTGQVALEENSFLPSFFFQLRDGGHGFVLRSSEEVNLSVVLKQSLTTSGR